MAKKRKKSPADQAIRPGKGGIVPPKKGQFKPGKSGNPAGRPSNAGATIKEWINQFAQQGFTEVQLRKIARDKKAPWPKRAAAERILRTLEAGDIADFTPLLEGKVKTLAELRRQGVNTELVKKFRQKSRMVPTGEEDETEEVIEREIELHDRAGDDFDRIVDRTDGRPRQSIELDATVANTNEQTVIRDLIQNDPDALELALQLESRLHQPGGAGGDAD